MQFTVAAVVTWVIEVTAFPLTRDDIDLSYPTEAFKVYVNVLEPVTFTIYVPLYPVGVAPEIVTSFTLVNPCGFKVVQVAVVADDVSLVIEIDGFIGGGSIVINGGVEYPRPGFVITIPEIVLFTVLRTAYPVAVDGVIGLPTGGVGGAENAILGVAVYPPPEAVMFISVTEPTTTA